MSTSTKEKPKKLTPLMEQYTRIKSKYPDIILFFRLGDFYEMFEEDAKIASSVLNITLTARHGTPMCGIPYHSSESYLLRLMKAGLKVAICEQMEAPTPGKKIVDRDVVRVLTKGTVVEENYLDDKVNNYLLGIFPDASQDLKIYLLCIDVSTGDFLGTILEGVNTDLSLIAELSKYQPQEVLVPQRYIKDKKLNKILKERNISVSLITKEDEDDACLDQELLNKIDNKLKEDKHLYNSYVSSLNYLLRNNKNTLKQIKPLKIYNTKEFMSINENTLEHLELVENYNTKKRSGSLIDILDHTVTPMGARLLRNWLLTPLMDITKIKERQTIVDYFYKSNLVREEIREILKPLNDIERLISRINCSVNLPKDLIHLKNTLNTTPKIRALLTENKTELIVNDIMKELLEGLDDFDYIKDVIQAAINDNPPNNLKDGVLIKEGFSKELDELKEIKRTGHKWLSKFEQGEREKTGISKLKVGYNNIFGYYIEVTKANKDLVPENYVRIQTLVNSERFTQEELKTYETKLVKAENEIINIETRIYNEIRDMIRKEVHELQILAHKLALLDVYSNLAYLALKYDYICPEVYDGYDIDIKDARHPVVDASLKDVKFVPNDIKFGLNDTELYIITGPNMAGKSTYIRQVALIIIMAQIGSFVPANYARVGLVDKIYTRIGASDKLSRGESTFMVEMKEVADVIKGATNRSLVILDEVGRGTSTFDGISLAWAIVEELVKRNWYNSSNFYNDTDIKAGPKTLFATHYFELTELAQIYSTVKNYNMSVKEVNEKIIFLYKLIEGCGDGSYGIHVAELAGVPLPIILKAKEKLLELTQNAINDIKSYKIKEKDPQLDLFDDKKKILDEIKNIDVNNLSPLEALLKIKQWQK